MAREATLGWTFSIRCSVDRSAGIWYKLTMKSCILCGKDLLQPNSTVSEIFFTEEIRGFNLDVIVPEGSHQVHEQCAYNIGQALYGQFSH